MTQRRSRLLATLVTLMVLASAPGVAAHAPDPVLSDSLWDQSDRLGFRWRSGAEPPADIRTAIRAAADDNNATRASQSAIFAYDSGATSLIGYGPGATCGVNGIACFTRTVPTSFTMWLREHGRSFDWGTLRWCQLEDSPTNGCYDAETVALDEFGHVQVLAHHVNYADDRDYLDAVVQTVSRTRPKEGWDEHVYGRCDVATLQVRYDALTSATPISTCLHLSTVLTLTASPTSISYGGSTKLTATLRITTSSSYRRLSGNALSSRTVRLQRRPVGGSTWTTIATMSPGASSGTYATSLTMQVSAEFRAVFPSPSTEGLTGDTSGTVRVTVGPCSGTLCPARAGR